MPVPFHPFNRFYGPAYPPHQGGGGVEEDGLEELIMAYLEEEEEEEEEDGNGSKRRSLGSTIADLLNESFGSEDESELRNLDWGDCWDLDHQHQQQKLEYEKKFALPVNGTVESAISLATTARGATDVGRRSRGGGGEGDRVTDWLLGAAAEGPPICAKGAKNAKSELSRRGEGEEKACGGGGGVHETENTVFVAERGKSDDERREEGGRKTLVHQEEEGHKHSDEAERSCLLPQMSTGPLFASLPPAQGCAERTKKQFCPLPLAPPLCLASGDRERVGNGRGGSTEACLGPFGKSLSGVAGFGGGTRSVRGMSEAKNVPPAGHKAQVGVDSGCYASSSSLDGGTNEEYCLDASAIRRFRRGNSLVSSCSSTAAIAAAANPLSAANSSRTLAASSATINLDRSRSTSKTYSPYSYCGGSTSTLDAIARPGSNHNVAAAAAAAAATPVTSRRLAGFWQQKMAAARTGDSPGSYYSASATSAGSMADLRRSGELEEAGLQASPGYRGMFRPACPMQERDSSNARIWQFVDMTHKAAGYT